MGGNLGLWTYEGGKERQDAPFEAWTQGCPIL